MIFMAQFSFFSYIKIKRHLWTALNNTLWAFKAEKGSEFIAAHRPGPYSHQQLAKNYDHSSAEKATLSCTADDTS